MAASDEPIESGASTARVMRRRLLLGAAVLIVIACVAAVVNLAGDEEGGCAELRRELAQIERDVPVDAAQACEDIYELQDALARRDGLRAELRTRGCD